MRYLRMGLAAAVLAAAACASVQGVKPDPAVASVQACAQARYPARCVVEALATQDGFDQGDGAWASIVLGLDSAAEARGRNPTIAAVLEALRRDRAGQSADEAFAAVAELPYDAEVPVSPKLLAVFWLATAQNEHWRGFAGAGSRSLRARAFIEWEHLLGDRGPPGQVWGTDLGSIAYTMRYEGMDAELQAFLQRHRPQETFNEIDFLLMLGDVDAAARAARSDEFSADAGLTHVAESVVSSDPERAVRLAREVAARATDEALRSPGYAYVAGSIGATLEQAGHRDEALAMARALEGRADASDRSLIPALAAARSMREAAGDGEGACALNARLLNAADVPLSDASVRAEFDRLAGVYNIGVTIEEVAEELRRNEAEQRRLAAAEGYFQCGDDASALGVAALPDAVILRLAIQHDRPAQEVEQRLDAAWDEFDASSFAVTAFHREVGANRIEEFKRFLDILWNRGREVDAIHAAADVMRRRSVTAPIEHLRPRMDERLRSLIVSMQEATDLERNSSLTELQTLALTMLEADLRAGRIRTEPQANGP